MLQTVSSHLLHIYLWDAFLEFRQKDYALTDTVKLPSRKDSCYNVYSSHQQGVRVPKKLGEIKTTQFFSSLVLLCITSEHINWSDVFIGDNGTCYQNQMFPQPELEVRSPDTQLQ